MNQTDQRFPELGADRLKRIAALAHAKYRRRYGLSFTEGVRSVRAAFVSGAPVVEVVVSQSAVADLATELPLDRLPVFVVAEQTLARISDVGTDQGVLATFRIPIRNLADDVRGLHKVIVLDGIQDPGNVGTIIRTAAWYGVDAVVAGPGTADVYSPKVVRATMGGVWALRIYREVDLSASVDELRGAGLTLCAAVADGSGIQPRPEKLALVLGSEAHGVSAELLRRADRRLAVHPAVGAGHDGIDSLNVAVAAGILMDRLFGVA